MAKLMTTRDSFALSMLLVGIMLGRYISHLIWKSKNKPPPVIAQSTSGPICPCGHLIGSHQSGNSCHDLVYRSGIGWRSCPCTKYYGPEIITNEFFNPGTHIQ